VPGIGLNQAYERNTVPQAAHIQHAIYELAGEEA
jgi:hypothetical protein